MTEGLWRVVEPNGTTHYLDENHTYLAGVIRDGGDVREAVVRAALDRGWPIAAILAPAGIDAPFRTEG